MAVVPTAVPEEVTAIRARIREDENNYKLLITNYQLPIIMSEDKKSKSVWGIVLKVIITVATAIAGALGLGACK